MQALNSVLRKKGFSVASSSVCVLKLTGGKNEYGDCVAICGSGDRLHYFTMVVSVAPARWARSLGGLSLNQTRAGYKTRRPISYITSCTAGSSFPEL